MWNSNPVKINNFKRYPVLVENFITQICLCTEKLKRKSSNLYYPTENRSNLNGDHGRTLFYEKSHCANLLC